MAIVTKYLPSRGFCTARFDVLVGVAWLAGGWWWVAQPIPIWVVGSTTHTQNTKPQNVTQLVRDLLESCGGPMTHLHPSHTSLSQPSYVRYHPAAQAFTERVFESNAADVTHVLWATTKMEVGTTALHVALE